MVETRISSLVLLRKNGRILLGLKKRGFGLGKWNGFGGKVESGELLHECAKRELFEESGIRAECLEKVGFLVFEFLNDPLILHVHVYAGKVFYGEPYETAEMKPQWFPETEIPFDKMWADDKYWFPLFLKGAKFQGYFKFSDMENIANYKLEEVTDIS